MKRKSNKTFVGFSLMLFFSPLFLAGVGVQLEKISGREVGLCELGINN